MTTTITTFLTYDTQAEEAVKLYTSLFDGKIKDTMRYPAGGPKPEGSVIGMSWQIVPKQLGGLLSDKDRAKSGRAMQAMMGMRKLDLATLQAAFEGDRR